MEDVRLVVFDLEGTLSYTKPYGCSWQNLNFDNGITIEEDKKYYKLHRDGKITYQEWCNVFTALYRERGNPTRENVKKSLLNYTFFLERKRLSNFLSSKGMKLRSFPELLILL